MSIDRSIDYVEFPAIDLEAVQQFYETVFGWTFTSYGPEYVSFTDGRLSGGFFKSPKNSRSDNGAALVVLYAEKLELTQDRVVESGGLLLKEIFSFPGGRRFQFADPCGNELAVWSDT